MQRLISYVVGGLFFAVAVAYIGGFWYAIARIGWEVFKWISPG